MMKTNPSVFIVNDTYEIIVPVDRESFFWVRVGDKDYFDAPCGLMNTDKYIHKVYVPMEELNSACEYTVFCREVLNRQPHKAETGKTEEKTYKFSPPPKDNIKIYNISDAHSRVLEPIKAAKAYGQFDLLILNGDILDDCCSPESFMNVYEICSEITGGNIPVVSSRGNHDVRGKIAHKYGEYMPSAKGDIFYTFRAGSVWGIVLDCGEITGDCDPVYNFTVHCDQLREEQTKFLKNVVKNAEYAAEDIKTRIIVVHDPFFTKHTPPYDVTRDIFKEWFDLINPNIKPDLWLCGHSHLCEVIQPPFSTNEFGINTPLLMASTPGDNYFKGGGIEINDSGITVTFTDSNGEISDSIKL